MKCADDVYAPLLENERRLLEAVGEVIDAPKIIAFSAKKGENYIVRDYVPGETISEMVEKSTLSDKETFAITEKVCGVLKKLHSLEPPIIVRDIKPENIMTASACSLILTQHGNITNIQIRIRCAWVRRQLLHRSSSGTVRLTC